MIKQLISIQAFAFEGANISLGRGTEFPFQAYGSPYTKDFSFKFTPKPSYGSKNPPLNGQECSGEDLRNYPEALTGINLEWLIKAYKDYKSPAGKGDFFLKTYSLIHLQDPIS